MALARVVSFDGVSKDRMDQMKREMSEGEQPEGVPATEVVVLHDPEAEKSLVILFFENEADYKRGDETLNAMPAGDTPGKAHVRDEVRRQHADGGVESRQVRAGPTLMGTVGVEPTPEIAKSGV